MNNNERIHCPRCHFMARLPQTMEARYGFAVLAGTFEYQRHECGTLLAVVEIAGKEGKQECGDKCITATCPACECKCKGDNHGVGSMAA